MDFKARYQRNVLSRQPSVAVVYGGLRHGWSLYFGHHVRLGAGHGVEDGHDLSADLPGIHRRLFPRGFPVAARLLSAEPHHHLQRAQPAARPAVVSHRRVVFPVVQDDGGSRALLCGLHHLAAFRVSAPWCSLWCYRGGHGLPDMALHSQGRHQNARMDRHVPDRLHVHGSSPYYI